MKKTTAILLSLLCATMCFARKTHNEHNLTLSDEQAQNFKYYFYEAVRCLDTNQHDQTLLLLQYCEAIDSTDATTHLLLGITYELLGYDSIALNQYLQSIKYDETCWNARRKSVELLSTVAGNEKNAIASVQKELKLNPKNDDAWNVLALLYKYLGKSQKAINALNQLEKIVGIDEYISREKYQHYTRLRKHKKAIAEIDRLIAEYPDDYRYQVMKGNVLLSQNNIEGAHAIYQNIMQQNPDNPYLYISLSEYYTKINEPKQSLTCILKALQNHQLDIETKLRIVAIYADNWEKQPNENREFEQMLTTMVAQYPFEEEVYRYYALFLLKNNRVEEAEKTLHTMTDINPKNENTWNVLINMQIDKQNYAEVATLSQNAIKHLPHNAMMYFYSSIAAYMQNDYTAALHYLEQGTLFTTEDQTELKAQMYAQMGDIYHLLDKKQQAYETYEASLKINPNNINVLNNYAYFLSNDSTELQKAERMSSKTIQADPENPVYLDTYAWILYRQNKFTLALFYIKYAIELLTPETEGAEIWEHYGHILQSNGREKEAENAFEKAKLLSK